MPQSLLSNNLPDGSAVATLNGALATGATSLSAIIAAGAQLQALASASFQMEVRIEQEILYVPGANTVTAGTTQTWTGLVRAQEGTSQPASHPSGAAIFVIPTAARIPWSIPRLTAGGVAMTLDSAGHILFSGGSTPAATSIVSGADPNTGISVTGNDICGRIAFTTGATTIAGAQIRLTFATAWSTAPLSARGDISGGTAIVAGGACQVLNLSTTVADFAFVAKPSVNTAYYIYYRFN